MTPMTSPPAASAASASAPISPTRPPPYTTPIPRAARPAPTSRASAAIRRVAAGARSAEDAQAHGSHARTRAPGGAASSAAPRAARCEIAFFSPGVHSPSVRPPGGSEAGSKIGS